MFCKFLKKTKRIEFSVDGKPPKKTTGSLWSVNSPQTQLVVDLRQKAFDASQKAGLKDHFHGPVKLTLTVHAPNPLERKDRHDYLGDLDALVGGVFEALQPSPPENNKLVIHPLLKENKDIRNDVALIVADDAQIATILSKKRQNDKPFYTVMIESENS